MPRVRTSSLAFAAVFALVSTASLSALSPRAVAQDRTGVVRVGVVPEHADWTYGLGEKARFRVSVTRDGHGLAGIAVEYSCGPEQMPPTIERETSLPAAGITIDAGTMKEPGFLRCAVTTTFEGKDYRSVGTAGFAPDGIVPTVEDPADFDEFWAAGKTELARLPLDARLTPKPELSTTKADVYHVSLQNVGSRPDRPSRFYGMLAVPKGEGPFPGIFNPPGAGVRPYRGMLGMAEKGFLTLQVGIHGVPVDLDRGVYASLGSGPLTAPRGGYPTFNVDDPERYYYRRVYLGCVRALDFLTSHPKWDGKTLVATGGSQGGALTIVIAGLDSRVTALAPYYPALSDMTGYLKGRAGGWPHLLKHEEDGHRTESKVHTLGYYDVVNFARRVKVPGLYSWGFNDQVCPPTSMYAAYNVVTAPKELLLALETGHHRVPEQRARVNQWIKERAGRSAGE